MRDVACRKTVSTGSVGLIVKTEMNGMKSHLSWRSIESRRLSLLDVAFEVSHYCESGVPALLSALWSSSCWSLGPNFDSSLDTPTRMGRNRPVHDRVKT